MNIPGLHICCDLLSDGGGYGGACLQHQQSRPKQLHCQQWTLKLKYTSILPSEVVKTTLLLVNKSNNYLPLVESVTMSVEDKTMNNAAQPEAWSASTRSQSPERSRSGPERRTPRLLLHQYLSHLIDVSRRLINVLKVCYHCVKVTNIFDKLSLLGFGPKCTDISYM